MLWTCTACTTTYAPGPHCPHCGSTDYVPQGEPMAKNTIADGATNAVTGTGPAPEETAEELEAVEPEPTDGPTLPRPDDELELIEEAEAEDEEEALVRPEDSALKADWVAYVAALAPGSADDFSSLTKADLIDLATRLENA